MYGLIRVLNDRSQSGRLISVLYYDKWWIECMISISYKHSKIACIGF